MSTHVEAEASAKAGFPEMKSGWRTLLDPASDERRWRAPETVVMLLWCAIAGVAVAQHTPWADEMQAWLLADGVSWQTLFTHSLHYEGSGGLWHAFLKLLQLAHVSFTATRWLVAGVEAAAMAVLLRYAPFPPLVRWLLPFTFFLLYQDGVIARSYCLFAILAFPAAIVLRGRIRKASVWLALLLGLLANLSLHGLILSLGMALTAVLVWRAPGRRLPLRSAAPAAAVLLLLWSAAAFSMAPAADIDFSTGNNIHRSLAKIERSLGMRRAVPETLSSSSMAGLRPAALPVHERHGFARIWNRLSRNLAAVTYPLSSSRLLALTLVVCVVAQACLRRRQLVGGEPGFAEDAPIGPAGLAPYGLMALVFASLYLAPRHAGTLFTGFIVSAWLTWPAGLRAGSRPDSLRGRALPLERVTAALFVLVCAQQTVWTLHAIDEERSRPYAPGAMTAAYLRARGVAASGPAQPGVLLAGYYYGSIDPLLSFDRNLYFNQPPHRYWYWSTTMRTYDTAQGTLARHPAFIVVGGYESGPDAEITRDWQPITRPIPGVLLGDNYSVVPFFEAHGYRVTRVFCGHSWMRASYAELLCDTVLEPVPTSPLR